MCQAGDSVPQDKGSHSHFCASCLCLREHRKELGLRWVLGLQGLKIKHQSEQSQGRWGISGPVPGWREVALGAVGTRSCSLCPA